jgi:8-oxo-dGTP pyrophosphatase MutT (NUDIX family)
VTRKLCERNIVAPFTPMREVEEETGVNGLQKLQKIITFFKRNGNFKITHWFEMESSFEVCWSVRRALKSSLVET